MLQASRDVHSGPKYFFTSDSTKAAFAPAAFWVSAMAVLSGGAASRNSPPERWAPGMSPRPWILYSK
jgi:hypothetical protein